MNYDQPRELKGGGWHYTSRNDDRIIPIGYCADHVAVPHPDEEGARRCYQDYLLEERLVFHTIEPQLKVIYLCEVMDCQERATKNAIINGWEGHRLCDAHANPATVRTIVGDLAGDSIHS